MNEIIAAAKGCGGRGYGYSRLKKQWTENVCWLAKAAHVPKCVTYRIDLLWVEPIHANKAERDRDNIEAGVKFLNDGLKLAKVVPDDKPENYLGSTHHHTKAEKPGVWVTVLDASDPSRAETPILGSPETRADGRYAGRNKPGG